ncbi:Hypothetical protein, putative [Bodo saltans]|uniref:Transmembrane protein n=1 Tax=Bodo saltans TaxID=75058 RepID=A0A0S4IMS5_BODSA|nr:Hypothetical protein, putative [Bodo saltans]|eukprot:CUE73128.1 Hypothetical protein, putative [Bodo saltans]
MSMMLLFFAHSMKGSITIRIYYVTHRCDLLLLHQILFTHKLLTPTTSEHPSTTMAVPHVFNPKNPRQNGSQFRKLPNFTKAFLPLALLFAVGGGAWAMKWSQDRRDHPCVDCKRQQEIAEEIYFGKKKKPTSSSMTGTNL